MFIGIESSVTFRDFSCFLMASEKVLGISLLVRILVLVWVSITVLFRFLGLVSHWYWCGTDSLLYVLLSFGPLWQVSEYQVSDHSFVGQVSPPSTCTSGKSLIWYSSIHLNSLFCILYQFSVFCLRTSEAQGRNLVDGMMPFRYLLFNYGPGKLWHYCILEV